MSNKKWIKQVGFPKFEINDFSLKPAVCHYAYMQIINFLWDRLP